MILYVKLFGFDINLLKTKRILLNIRNQSVLHCKHFPPITHKAKVAVCAEIHTKLSAQSEHHVECLNVKPGGMQSSY
jgi:hypothetical protein